MRQSVVLLKNDKNALPLPRTLKRLHVAGVAAADLGMQCGGWTIAWQGSPGEVTHGGTTLLAAIRNSVAPGTEVTYSTNAAGAAGADAVLAVIGEKPYAEMMGDRADLRVAPEDLALVKELRRRNSRGDGSVLRPSAHPGRGVGWQRRVPGRVAARH